MDEGVIRRQKERSFLPKPDQSHPGPVWVGITKKKQMHMHLLFLR